MYPRHLVYTRHRRAQPSPPRQPPVDALLSCTPSATQMAASKPHLRDPLGALRNSFHNALKREKADDSRSCLEYRIIPNSFGRLSPCLLQWQAPRRSSPRIAWRKPEIRLAQAVSLFEADLAPEQKAAST